MQKLRKSKNKSAKAWKGPLEELKQKHPNIPSIVLREYAATCAEAHGSQKQCEVHWTIVCPIHPDEDFQLGSETELQIDLEFDLDEPLLRHVVVTQKDCDWKVDFMDDFNERKFQDGFVLTKKDELCLAKVKEIDSWERTIRASMISDTALARLSTNTKRASDLFEFMLKWASENKKGLRIAVESTKKAYGDVMEFATAWLVVMKKGIMTTEQAELLKKYFIASSWPQSKPPKHVQTWCSSASDNPDFLVKLQASIEAIRNDTGAVGQAIRAAMDTPPDQWRESNVWEWIMAFPEWQKSFSKEALQPFQERLVKWCDTHSQSLLQDLESECDADVAKRLEQLKALGKTFDSISVLARVALQWSPR